MIKKKFQAWHIFLTYVLFFVALSVSLIFVEKGEVVLFVNGAHNSIFDWLIKCLTHLGDGLIFLPLFLLAVISKRKKFTYRVVLVFLVHALIVVLLKQFLFSDIGRPKSFFDDLNMLHFVEGVKVHSKRSFPSGHTASAFAAAVLLSFMYRKSWVLVATLIAASVVGMSRMYLLQHFYVDVVLGAVIGFSSSFLICMLPFNRSKIYVRTQWEHLVARVRGTAIRPETQLQESTTSFSQTDPSQHI